MSNLEEYIKQNLEAFDDQELPEGHRERFEAKLAEVEERPALRQSSGTALRQSSGTALRQISGTALRQNPGTALRQSSGIAQKPNSATVLRPRSGKVWWWTAIAGVAAAVAAVAIFINQPASSQKDWFADIPEDQASICQAYYDQMAAMYSDILMTDVDGSKEAQLMTIAEETIPMIDQLPEEMGEEERALILKEYYSDLLEGIEKIGRIK